MNGDRAAVPGAIRQGDVVEVRSPEEIMRTLDGSGSLDALPFMPEMAAFSGQRFVVDRRADKVCDTINDTGSRTVPNAVLLADLRCDGAAHGGCQAECRFFWKEAWLKRVDAPAPAAAEATAGAPAASELVRLTAASVHPAGEPTKWRCQATQLFAASEHLRTFDPRPWVRAWKTHDVPRARLLRVLARALIAEPRRKLGFLDAVALRGDGATTPTDTALGLRPGDTVEVKDRAELAHALTTEGKNKGLRFDQEMLPFCGKTFTVRQRIRRFIDDRTGRMIELKTDSVTLDGVVCSGDWSTSRWLCPRGIYPYWREGWLRRVEAPVTSDQRDGAAPDRRVPRRVSILGVPVDALTMDETVEIARSMVRSGRPHQHVGFNAALVVESERDPALRRVLERCDVVSADGMSAVLAGRLVGQRVPERVAGIDLFQRLVAAAHVDGSSVYFLGATADVVERTVAVFGERHPGLRVAGYRDGYWKDDASVVRAIRAARPDYLFVAIPSPRKELWLDRYLDDLGVPFAMGVGGSFDVVAGKVKRAPRWIQDAGFEWAWRLAQEPRRMWRRYLFSNAAFARSLARAYWRARV